MAEAVGLAASMFATIQIADRVISLCKRYIESIRDTPRDLRTILIETAAVRAILESVEFIIECDNGQSAIFNSLSGSSGPVEGCYEAMKDLEGLFRTEMGTPRMQRRPRGMKAQTLVTLATLAWPLKESKARKILRDITTHKSTIALALTTGTVYGVRDIAQRTDAIQESLSEFQRRELFKWLELTDPTILHHRAQKNYEAGTCDWATRYPAWSGFLNGTKRCLWIHGIPGAGKTVLASQLIEKVAKHCNDSNSARTLSVYYYCYFGHNQGESTPFLKWVLSSLSRRSGKISEYLWKLFSHGGTPSLRSLQDALELCLHDFDIIYIVIDAVDESSPREGLLNVIRDLVTDPRFAKIHLLATSREYLDIETVMSDVSTSVSMSNQYVNDDIRNYTRLRLDRERTMKRWSPELRQETLEVLVKGAKGMFRGVVCQIDSLRRIKGSASAIRIELRRLPESLNETYDRIFQQIATEDLFVVNCVLKWLYFEIEIGEKDVLPLNVLVEAVDEEMSREISSRRNLLRDTETIREVCGCLVTVSPDAGGVYQDGLISFAHYTVVEYLISTRRPPHNLPFAEDRSSLALEKAELLFERALRVNKDDVVGGDHSGVSSTLFNTFARYSVNRSMKIITRFEAVLSEDEGLFNLITDLLDEGKEHGSSLILIGGSAAGEYCEPWARHMVGFTWKELPDVEVRILTRLLLCGCSHLAEIWSKRIDLRRVLRTDLNFEYDCCDRFEMQQPWSVRGSLTSCFAVIYPVVGIEILRALFRFGAGLFDPQSALFPFIAAHVHEEDCKHGCALEELLIQGAETNLRGQHVTALQIAVATLDVDAVSILLRANADPNAKGCSEASQWPKNSSLFAFNKFRGASPLRICRSNLEEYFEETDWSFTPMIRKTADDARSRIESMLTECGAEDESSEKG